MTPYIKSLLILLNEGEVPELSEFDRNEFWNAKTLIASELKFSYEDGEWKQSGDPRYVHSLGMKATDVFKKFIKVYNHNYRVDQAVKEFYKLTDDEIIDMMDELPYFNKAYSGHEKFKPTAANFLKGKIWLEDYPRKINRDRSRKKTIHEITTWDEYKAILPKENHDTIESYISLGIKFADFKSMIQNEIQKG